MTIMLFAIPLAANAHNTINDCSAQLQSDTLIVENNHIIYRWLWNQGEIIPVSIHDKLNNKTLYFANKQSDCRIAQKNDAFIKNLSFKVKHIDSTYMSTKVLEVEIINQYANFQQKRSIRIFPNVPTISFDYAFKYQELNIRSEEKEENADGVEAKLLKKVSHEQLSVVDYHFNQKHWKYQSIAFKDMTDQNDNLVFKQSTVPYNGASKQLGNLLFCENLLSGFKFFILKESPNGTSQIAYPNYDFAISNRGLSMPITGIEHHSNGNDFISAYTITLGVLDKQTNGLTSLRKYLKQSVPYNTSTHDMILMNTWGDRSQDGRISEQFIIKEINKAAKLGITHFQIDDGWQQGTSANSAFKHKDKNWDNWSKENWEPNKERFPNGLHPIVKLAKKRNIKLGLWFNPSKENDYATWERDAEIIINLHKTYGIKYYKIDGVSIPTKRAATNFEQFLKRVKEETNGEVFFNLDLTAGVRGGYFSYRYAGNLFLENRYTDFQNYYPYKTLRNLWMLAQYFPPELLQIEFLNKWRNKWIYPKDDIFAPAHYDLEYLFAITMVAQPLAWFEATKLPAEADGIADLINEYKAIQTELHSGTSLPIGDEPSGRSWTGFQTIVNNESGFFLIFREDNDNSCAEMETYLEPNSEIRLTLISGSENEIEEQSHIGNKIKFTLHKKNSFALYRYETIR